jgi:SRSO17 transposase
MIHHIPVHSETILEEAGILNIAPDTILNLISSYLALFCGFFWRKGQFEHFKLTIHGILSDLSKKNLENICLNFSHPKNKGNLYHFMRDAKFDAVGILKLYQSLLAHLLSDQDGMFTGDGCDFLKKGHFSVAAGRQFCGPIGKCDNCQASVMLVMPVDLVTALLTPLSTFRKSYLKKNMKI